MPRLDRDGVQINYEVHGSGPAILLTHGFPATLESWRGQVGPLSADHTLIIWDMRGHGQSDAPDDPAAYSAEATVDDMAALLDEVGAASAVIGGLSMGGYFSLAFQHRYPERVNAMLILGTGPGYRNDEAREAWNRSAIEKADRFANEGLAAGMAVADPPARSSVHRSALGLAGAARGMLVQRDSAVIDSLGEIAVPALVAVGEQDERFHRAADYMAAKIPGAQKVVVPGAAHWMQLDQPEFFDRMVLDFLARVEEPGAGA